MSVVVQFGKYEAVIDNGEWSSPVPSLTRMLNGSLNPGEVVTAAPDLDLVLAREMATRLKGKVVEYTPPENPPAGIDRPPYEDSFNSEASLAEDEHGSPFFEDPYGSWEMEGE